MLDNLTQRMARVVKTLRGEARLTEANTQEMLREVRRTGGVYAGDEKPRAVGVGD